TQSRPLSDLPATWSTSVNLTKNVVFTSWSEPLRVMVTLFGRGGVQVAGLPPGVSQNAALPVAESNAGASRVNDAVCTVGWAASSPPSTAIPATSSPLPAAVLMGPARTAPVETLNWNRWPVARFTDQKEDLSGLSATARQLFVPSPVAAAYARVIAPELLSRRISVPTAIM